MTLRQIKIVAAMNRLGDWLNDAEGKKARLSEVCHLATLVADNDFDIDRLQLDLVNPTPGVVRLCIAVASGQVVLNDGA